MAMREKQMAQTPTKSDIYGDRLLGGQQDDGILSASLSGIFNLTG
jgi:hypothetical protein